MLKMYHWLPMREIPWSTEQRFSDKDNQRSSNSITWELVKKAKFSSPTPGLVTQKLWGWAPAIWGSWCTALVTHFINKTDPNVFVPNTLQACLSHGSRASSSNRRIRIRDKGKTPHTRTGLLAVLDTPTFGPLPWPFPLSGTLPFPFPSHLGLSSNLTFWMRPTLHPWFLLPCSIIAKVLTSF